METRNFLDSTYLKTPSQSGLSEKETLDKVYELTREALDYGMYAVMIRPEYVKPVKEFLAQQPANQLKVGTVIGFHEGTASVAEKLQEAQKAIEDGVDELDFVINYEAFKQGNVELLKFEFLRGTELCIKNQKVAKWIIEVAALTNEQIAAITKNLLKWATISFPQEQLPNIFVKSSTGFYQTEDGKPNGATKETIQIMIDNAGELSVKAAGGVRTPEEAQEMIKMGVKRIGTSSAKALLEEDIAPKEGY